MRALVLVMMAKAKRVETVGCRPTSRPAMTFFSPP